MKKLTLLSLLFYLLLFPGSVLSQTDPGKEVEAYSSFYIDTVSNQAILFSGRVQKPINRFTESLYLRDRYTLLLDDWGRIPIPEPIPSAESYAPGNLEYDGVKYPNLYMKLDLYRDELVVRTPARIHGVVLDPEKFESADLQGYRILYITANDPTYNLPEGYYQELYSGDTRVLRKETYQFNVTERKFVNQSIRYYIVKDGVVKRVNNRKGPVLKALREHRRELDRFIRDHKLNLKNHGDASLTLIVAEYDKLNQQAGL